MNATAELDKGVTLNTIRLMVAKQVMSDTELTDLQVARPWAPPTHSELTLALTLYVTFMTKEGTLGKRS